MRRIIITKDKANKRIDRVLKDTFIGMPQNALYKAFRKKDIKVNGVWVKEDYQVKPNDSVDIYIVDDILDGVSKQDSSNFSRAFSVVYEDKNLLVVNKNQGIPVHPDRNQSENTLIHLVLDYLTQKENYNENHSFTPSLCHRLDRNTGGLVMIAKNDQTLKVILEKMKTGEIKKYYQCLVIGKVEKKEAVLKAFLEKDDKNSRVYIKTEKTRNSFEILTKYRLLSYENFPDINETISRLEVELVTGRTHQIRAHLAFTGHPLVGDGKYGTNSFNRLVKARYQALWACRIVFDFKRDAGILGYLKGKKLEVAPEYELRNR